MRFLIFLIALFWIQTVDAKEERFGRGGLGGFADGWNKSQQQRLERGRLENETRKLNAELSAACRDSLSQELGSAKRRHTDLILTAFDMGTSSRDFIRRANKEFVTSIKTAHDNHLKCSKR